MSKIENLEKLIEYNGKAGLVALQAYSRTSITFTVGAGTVTDNRIYG